MTIDWTRLLRHLTMATLGFLVASLATVYAGEGRKARWGGLELINIIALKVTKSQSRLDAST